MRVPVRGEKQQLEDQHAHSPNGCRTAKKPKDFLAEQQLNLEEQKRTEEDRRGKRQRSNPTSVRSRRGRTGNKDCLILWGHDESLDGDIHSITSVGELLRRARLHLLVCAQFTMHNVAGNRKFLLDPICPRSCLRPFGVLIASECGDQNRLSCCPRVRESPFILILLENQCSWLIRFGKDAAQRQDR